MKARWARKLLVFLGAAAVLSYSVGPFVWIVIASITPETSARLDQTWQSVRHVVYFPSHPSLSNYFQLFSSVPFATYMRNSAIVAAGTMVLALTTASFGAYGFVRFRFRGRNGLLMLMLMTYMIPSIVLLVPLLVIFRGYGLINSYPGLILAESTITAPFTLLLMINFFSALPRELEEAAQIDGCTRLQAFLRIVVPLSIPGLVAGGLFAFIMAWNDFIFAFLLTTTDAVKTLPVIMRMFALGEPAVWGVSAAGAVLTTLPVALIFLVFQKTLVSGLAAGAVKG